MILYDTLTKKYSPVVPLTPNKISMYACGLTPDGPMHLGHAATSIYNDVLVRYFLYMDFDVNFVQNITDIDDDILSKSKKAGTAWQEFGEFWTEKFLKDVKRLHVLKDHDFKKATDSIPTMIAIISKLLKNGHAYESNGSIYYDVTSFPSYGNLSHFTEDLMLKIAAERGGHVDDPDKRSPLDFVLWQKSLDNEPSWKSPWSKGRPGWHIECSSMIKEFLGIQIDIHGGGKDLIFPHHESERAQSEGYSGKKFVGHWFHVAMVMYEAEKMSKSLGNLILVDDLLKKFSANQIRYFVLQHHYRFPWEYFEEDMESAAKEWKSIEESLAHVEMDKTNTLLDSFLKALENDLCTPKAMEILRQSLAKMENPAAVKKSFEMLGFLL